MNSTLACTPAPRHARAFTLVELLVVISIIGVLIATLLPALGQSRLNALRLKHSNNLRQLGQGFLNYVADNKDTLPSRKYPWATGEFGANRFYCNQDIIYDIDLRSPITQYGTMSATANVLMNTPPLSDAGNMNSVLNWNLSWFPGNGILTPAESPVRLSQATAQMAMMMDNIQTDPGMTVFYATNVPHVPPILLYGGNLSAQFSLTSDPNMIPGEYAVRYDASVRWVPFRDINFIPYVNGWRNSYINP